MYAPTSAVKEEEIEQFYGSLEDEFERAPKSDVLYVVEDFNAKLDARRKLERSEWGFRRKKGERAETSRFLQGMQPICGQHNVRST